MAVEVIDLVKGRHYYYKTVEETLRCIICKKCYKLKKICCGEYTLIHIKERTGIIELNLKKYNCSCYYGSTLIFSKYWEDKRREKNLGYCKHHKAAVKEIKYRTVNGISMEAR